MNIINFFTRLNERAVLMDAMISKLGLTDTVASLASQPDVLRRATFRCHTCERPQECAEWLADAQDPTEAPAYCKNHDLFERMMDRAASV